MPEMIPVPPAVAPAISAEAPAISAEATRSSLEAARIAAQGEALVVILPLGDGKVATGEFDPIANAFGMHKKGDTLIVPLAVAEALEARGYAMVQA